MLLEFNNVDIKDTLFIFCSKTKNSIKVLEFDNSRIWLYQKKLNSTKFIHPSLGDTSSISKENLKILINGLDFISKIEGKLDVQHDYY